MKLIEREDKVFCPHCNEEIEGLDVEAQCSVSAKADVFGEDWWTNDYDNYREVTYFCPLCKQDVEPIEVLV